MTEKVEQIKLILLGDEKVGKSCFFERYINGKFLEEYNPSVKTQFKKLNINIDGKNFNIQIWDTPGNEQKHKIYNSIYLKSNCIIILFNVAYKSSFDNIFIKWIPNFYNFLKIKRIDNFPIVILGNFTDLDKKREITKQEIQNKLKQIENYTNYYFYHELSIKNENSLINLINKIVLFAKNKPKIIESKENNIIEELKVKIKSLETERNTLKENITMLEEVKNILIEKGKKIEENNESLNEAIKKLTLEKKELNEKLNKNEKKDNDEIKILNDKINALELQKNILFQDNNEKIEKINKLNEKLNEFNENLKKNEIIIEEYKEKYNLENQAKNLLKS